jgi:hypothetical protein
MTPQVISSQLLAETVVSDSGIAGAERRLLRWKAVRSASFSGCGILTRTSAHKLVSSLLCDAERNFIAAGIENPDDGAGMTPVYVW